MKKCINLTKVFIVILLIIAVLCNMAIKFYRPSFVDFLLKVNPQFITELYPDYLASIDEVQFENIIVTDKSISMNIKNFDSGLAVKNVEWNKKDECVYVYVYKGFSACGDEFVDTVYYEADITNITKIIHIDANEIEKVIWER